jgi:hypothetical protein
MRSPARSLHSQKEKRQPLVPSVAPAPRPAMRQPAAATIQRKLGPNAADRKVINNKTGKIYIARSSGPGRYRLDPVGFSLSFLSADLIVDQDNDDYDILMESPTEQNLKARRREIDHLTRDVPPRAKEALLEKLIASEKRRAPDEHVFYNAAGPGARSIHKITKILLTNLHATTYHMPLEGAEFEFLRAPSHEFNPLMGLNPQVFLDHVLQNPSWSDRSEPKPVLSTNMSIFGDIQAGGAENSFTIYFNKGLFDVDQEKACGIVESLLKTYLLDKKLYRELMSCTVEFLNLLKKRPPNAAIYQILVSDEALDQLAYISIQSGHPLDSELGRHFGLHEKMGGGLSHINPRSAAFTRGVLESAQSAEYWSKFEGGNDPQARLITNPNYFATPNHLIRIRVFEDAEPTAHLFAEFNRRVWSICRKYVDFCYRTLERFIKKYRRQLAILKINFSLEPADGSVSVLGDQVRSLKKIEALIKSYEEL